MQALEKMEQLIDNLCGKFSDIREENEKLTKQLEIMLFYLHFFRFDIKIEKDVGVAPLTFLTNNKPSTILSFFYKVANIIH